MSAPFTIEWLGGPAEYHFRKARPAGDFDWDSLRESDYPAPLVVAARRVWMGLVISEYAAINAFADVVAALAQACAPLDLIGMTSDFLADEVRHVELASRVVMRLGGAMVCVLDPARLSQRTPTATNAFERANELALRVGCVAEVFAGSTALPIMKATSHPLLRAVYTSILRDEARHSRFGSLYFEWAGERLTDEERARLGKVTLDALRTYAPLWQCKQEASPPDWSPWGASDLGWLESRRYVPIARSTVLEDVLPPLRGLGILLPEVELAQLLA